MFRFLITFLLVTLATLPARAQDTTPAERDLALALAQVAANEAGLVRIVPADVALIWQVTTARAETTRDRLAWLRAHSSCVLTDRPLTDFEARGNCVWTRHLDARGRRPEGFPAHLSWQRYAERWAQVRALALGLVTGTIQIEPCPEAPFTWGGPMDHRRALERGMRPLDCRDPSTGLPTRNQGYALR